MAKKKEELTDFENALKHRYRVEPGGEFVPGVTTAIGIIEKPAFKWTASGIAATAILENTRRKKTIVKNHREKLASYRPGSKERILAQQGNDDEIFIHWGRGEFDRQWKAKAEIGTRVHDIAERWTRGEAVDVRVEDSKYVDALEMFHKGWKPKFKLVECIVLNYEFKYGGRFDGIGELDGPMAEGVFNLDYKTGGEYEDSVALQHIAYMKCQLPIYNENGKLIGFKPLPRLDGARTIYLRPDGTCGVKDPFAHISQELAWETFEACLRLYKATQTITQLLKGIEDGQ